MAFIALGHLLEVECPGGVRLTLRFHAPVFVREHASSLCDFAWGAAVYQALHLSAHLRPVVVLGQVCVVLLPAQVVHLGVYGANKGLASAPWDDDAVDLVVLLVYPEGGSLVF